MIKTALVTGGARRLGRAMVEAVHAQGLNVMIHCNRSTDEAHQLANELNDVRTESAHVVQANLTQDDRANAILEDTLTAFGRLDLLINNASTFYPTPLGNITNDDWNDLLGSNLKAPLMLSQACAPSLRSHHGAIVNLIDIYAERPLLSYSTYCAAKAGLASLTRSLAIELAPDIRVNGIAPGAMLWPENPDHPLDENQLVERIPLRRLGGATDIAKATVFLGLETNYITGQILNVDGGRSIVN